jgi:transcriptional regulator with XRE-family HTH domain
MRRPRLEENREFYAAVGQRIAKLRTGRLTQEALANRTGLTRTSIINIEKGRQQILLHTLMDISRALQVPVSDLIPEIDNLEMMLRDKPQTALNWIRSAASKSASKSRR